MTTEKLKEMSEGAVHDFIRERLKIDTFTVCSIRGDIPISRKQHLRFDMSGYDAAETGSCTVYNMSLVNKFADLGIYDYTYYLFLDFYKGSPVLYYRYFGEAGNLGIEMGGWRTVEIIYEIFKVTIFSGKGQRRRI